MWDNEQSHQLQTRLSTKERTAEYFLAIDPGFVHRRKIETVVGEPGMNRIDRLTADLPDLPEWQREVRIDQIYTKVLVGLCEAIGIHPLGQLLNEKKGRLFSSTETLRPAPAVYDAPRAISRIDTPGFELHSELHYSTEHIASTTLRTRLHDGDDIAIIAEQQAQRGDTLIFDPLVMGGPCLHPNDSVLPPAEAMWWGNAMGEVFTEDMDEFSDAASIDSIGWEVMAKISERAFKECLAEILQVTAPKDWGGEQSDLYTTDLRLGGKRTSAAFLLKGPAKFEPMTLNSLGKNNDQIVRLSKEPAGLLVVQHCHDIGQAVRDTLRVFAIQPGTMRRRYCLIDGRDSYRILKAYDKLGRAIELSRGARELGQSALGGAALPGREHS